MGEKTIYKGKTGRKTIQDHYENYLHTLPFEVERNYVDTSYGRTHMLMAGPKDGKPLFILQGGNCINPMTLSWFSPLANQYRIYAPDTIGHPGYSDQTRISATDHSFAQWVQELMDHMGLNKCAFIGPSYGAGITLRLAAYMPERIDCAVLVSPSGLKLGSKLNMIKQIVLPMLLFLATSSDKHLSKIANRMSANTMKEMDKQIIGDIFKHTKLEQEMPKLTEKKELLAYQQPTLIISGNEDVFFPEHLIKQAAHEVIPNLTDFKSYDMGHFPSEEHFIHINEDIRLFLHTYYK
ncbi:pimeloyl-ACP methyl ester carboxylesterase [Bacillus ectoiniformans]|uniref:alpha/beta fold hydrolase n=1 Tax=Bacillus ectoiniformans TaxID=1494429 RepID=UPI001957C625|nr:alpha/beta hydrolase [Bacillus ectoiniformans]MBM7648667.1 pimeloyl-ACP methyl ester carboxylesterase [Bacillus ectoiniformans]